MIENAVIHINNEQPLVADLFALPTAADACLICTNLRTTNGQRPVFAERSESVFVFPLIHIRFIELPPDALARMSNALPSRTIDVVSTSEAEDVGRAATPEPDLEIDEDFLRRIREV